MARRVRHGPPTTSAWVWGVVAASVLAVGTLVAVVVVLRPHGRAAEAGNGQVSGSDATSWDDMIRRAQGDSNHQWAYAQAYVGRASYRAQRREFEKAALDFSSGTGEYFEIGQLYKEAGGDSRSTGYKADDCAQWCIYQEAVCLEAVAGASGLDSDYNAAKDRYWSAQYPLNTADAHGFEMIQAYIRGGNPGVPNASYPWLPKAAKDGEQRMQARIDSLKASKLPKW